MQKPEGKDSSSTCLYGPRSIPSPGTQADAEHKAPRPKLNHCFSFGLWFLHAEPQSEA